MFDVISTSDIVILLISDAAQIELYPKTISKSGILAVYENLKEADKKIFDQAYGGSYLTAFEILLECYDEVSSGNEIRSVVMVGKRLERFPFQSIDASKMWQTGFKVREERVESEIPVNPFTSGVYCAVMMAQVDVLTEQGHEYSEIVNESVIEAVDFLNPYMHFKGVSFMLDNCSTTARLGSIK